MNFFLRCKKIDELHIVKLKPHQNDQGKVYSACFLEKSRKNFTRWALSEESIGRVIKGLQ
jgi:hypothetical protein